MCGLKKKIKVKASRVAEDRERAFQSDVTKIRVWRLGLGLQGNSVFLRLKSESHDGHSAAVTRAWTLRLLEARVWETWGATTGFHFLVSKVGKVVPSVIPLMP